MIAHLRGKLLSKQPQRAVIEAAGVGYDVAITGPAYSELPNLGAEVALFIHTHVREDALSLFGFVSEDEKRLFEKLISVSGIGPKLAITVLNGISTERLVAAIRSNDLASLTRISGIGKKTAERMVLELRDKLDTFAVTAKAPTSASAVEEDVLSALVNLGYQRAAAEQAIKHVPSINGKSASFDALFRETLAALRK
jgi:Holliday junction DNA helicase RuvA